LLFNKFFRFSIPSYPFTYPSGSYNYNSIKMCKQISTPPQPYQKIPDIYFLCSCSLPNFITIPSPITIKFVVDVFVLYVILYLLLYCLLCYLVLRPQSWINSTTTTTTWLSCEDIARQICVLAPRWRFFGDFLRPVFSASRVQHVSYLHRKFALRPHRVWKYGRHPICNRWD